MVSMKDIAQRCGVSVATVSKALKATYNISILFVDEQNSGMTHAYFSSVLESLKVEAESRGYDVTFINRNVGRRTP